MTELHDIVAAYDPTLPLERASTIPGTWYVDPRIAELERATVFGASWQLVARADQVAEPGQYVTADIAGEPIVVVRDQDGVLRGFFNVCRHHAAAVMTAPCGRADKLRCPYHGWTYDLTGRLRGTPEMAGVEGLERDAAGLVSVGGVAEWEQFVFVHLDANPPDLRGAFGALPAELAGLGIGGLRFCERRSFELACNWKVFVDNYLDGGYHVPHLHDGLASILDHRAYSIDNFERYCVQRSPVSAPAGSLRHGDARYYWLYPNLMLNWYEGYLDTNLVIPLGVDRMRVIFDFYFDDVSAERAERNRASMDVSERIQDEDHAICESVQRGLSSRAYGAGRLSVRREAGEHLFHRLLAADLQRGLDARAGARRA